jgi:diadenylate cyclase
MQAQKFTPEFATVFEQAVRLSLTAQADAVLVVLDGPTDWTAIKQRAGDQKVIVVADLKEELEGAAAAGLATVIVEMKDAPVFDKLRHSLVEAVGNEYLKPGSSVIAVYSSFDPGTIDTISWVQLEEHLARLSARDLRKLETSVPLETLKIVLDLAVEIGREGREGHPVGTMFVVGDTRRVLAHCHAAGFDPVKGYNRKDRNLLDVRIREAVKEIAPLDGAFIVSAEGIVEKSCQLIDALHADLTLSKGLGSRHWAGAAISKITKAISIVVSQSSGTVRLFQNGQIMLRVEPFRQALKWKGSEAEPPQPPPEPPAVRS